MGVSDFLPAGYGDKQAVRVMTVDRTRRRVECALRDGAAVYAAVWEVPVVFRWPKTGEIWMIRKDSGVWRLDSLVQDTSKFENTPLSDLEEGQARVHAETLWNDKGDRFVTTSEITGFTGAEAAPDACQGRLTLVSGTPVSQIDTWDTTLYFTPYKGNSVSVFDGAVWVNRRLAEPSISLTSLSSNHNYDVFLSSDLALSLVAWADDTTRATDLAQQDGIYVKTGDPTKRYLGTIRTSNTGHGVDSTQSRFVWNYYNRVTRDLRSPDIAPSVSDTSGSKYYEQHVTSTSYVHALDSTQYVYMVTGIAEDALKLDFACSVYTQDFSTEGSVTIGEDSTSAPCPEAIVAYLYTHGKSPDLTYDISYENPLITVAKTPTIGYHYYNGLVKCYGPSRQNMYLYGMGWNNTHSRDLTSGLRGLWIA